MLNENNTRNGSVLVFTLFLMMVTLIVAMGIMNASNLKLVDSGYTSKSVQAFQTADYGLERFIDAMKKRSSTSTISSVIPNKCQDDFIDLSVYFSNTGVARVTFFDVNGDQLECDDIIDQIKTIKSVGEYGGVVRAVEVNLP